MKKIEDINKEIRDINWNCNYYNFFEKTELGKKSNKLLKITFITTICCFILVVAMFILILVSVNNTRVTDIALITTIITILMLTIIWIVQDLLRKKVLKEGVQEDIDTYVNDLRLQRRLIKLKELTEDYAKNVKKKYVPIKDIRSDISITDIIIDIGEDRNLLDVSNLEILVKLQQVSTKVLYDCITNNKALLITGKQVKDDSFIIKLDFEYGDLMLKPINKEDVKSNDTDTKKITNI